MSQSTRPDWVRAIKRFEVPSRLKAWGQILNTLLPLAGLWAAAYLNWRGGGPYGWSLLLLVPAGLLTVRTFILFHDCSHGSFFKSARANSFWGSVFGILTFTPYDNWRQSHGIHHNTHGNLDRRGVGDVWTLTVEEYKAQTPWMQLMYRIYRHPVMLFLIIPPVLFIVLHRLPGSHAGRREIVSTLIHNVLLVLFLGTLGWTLGWESLVYIHLPMFYLASVLGVWLFYVQHQFDPGYWERSEEWDNFDASMEGSSHYKLPKWLQWFTGNIGLHHIHHVRPRIPNYNLQACYDATPELQLPDPLTLRTSFSSLNMHLWDEANKRLLSFGQARKLALI